MNAKPGELHSAVPKLRVSERFVAGDYCGRVRRAARYILQILREKHSGKLLRRVVCRFKCFALRLRAQVEDNIVHEIGRIGERDYKAAHSVEHVVYNPGKKSFVDSVP